MHHDDAACTSLKSLLKFINNDIVVVVQRMYYIEYKLYAESHQECSWITHIHTTAVAMNSIRTIKIIRCKFCIAKYIKESRSSKTKEEIQGMLHASAVLKT